MHQSSLAEYAHTAVPILSWSIYKCFHHHTMSTQKIFLIESIEMRKKFVGLDRIFYFLYLTQRGNNSLTIDNITHFVLTQRITLNSERRVDGLNTIGLSKAQAFLSLQTDGITFYLSGNLRYQIDSF